jgi:5S rRNA maturation endonuclease (ribonuclease M5)
LTQRDKRFTRFVEFLIAFIDELNTLSKENSAAVLVEGQRDRKALIELGYEGKMLTKVSLSSNRVEAALYGIKCVIILTDLDREGRRLASMYMDFFLLRRVKVLTAQRRRLKHASHGVFLHVENLSRFAPQVTGIKGLIEEMRV